MAGRQSGEDSGMGKQMIEQISDRIRAELWELQDQGYKDFHAKLIPTVAPETIIGVRTPQVRKLAKKWAKAPQIGGVPGAAPP